MASHHAGLGVLLLLLLLLLPLPSTPTTLYVTPSTHTPCHAPPANPCHTLSEYVENATEYFISNTTMIFLPDEHTLKTQARIANLTSFSMVGESEDTSRIVCSGIECHGFYFQNISHLGISNLSFTSDSQSITTVNVYNLQLMNCTFANSSSTALIAHNSNLLLEGNTFVNNLRLGDGGHQKSLIPGGGIAAVFTNMTFQGKNNFLNNLCQAEQCGGGAIYAENSFVTLFDGNTSFINNTAISTSLPRGGGGGLFLFNSTISIMGHVDFIGNGVNNTVDVSASGGGGASLLYSNIAVSGTATFLNNFVSGNGNSRKIGGGIFLHNSNLSITGTVLINNNSAPDSGGGIWSGSSHISINGTVSLTANSAGQFGGGLVILDCSVNIAAGSVTLTDNYAGYAGGGIHLEDSNMDINGTVSLTDNSAGKLGGGISILDCSVNIAAAGSVTLTNNYAGLAGGGIHLEDSNMDINGKVVVTRNQAFFGGGISMVGTCSSAVCVIRSGENYAQQVGGMHAQEGRVYIPGTMSFANNSASDLGGGLLIICGSNMSITGSVVLTHNYAGYGGGGMDVQCSHMSTTGTVSLTNNYAGIQGGGMDVGNSALIIITVLHTNNSAGIYGGGTSMLDRNRTIAGNVSLTDNHAGSLGGGMNVQNSSIHIVGTVLFSNDSASVQGGGMYVQYSHISITGTLSLTNSSAGTRGGGIAMFGSNMTITGSMLLTDNYAGNQGGGMDVQNSSIHITGILALSNNSADNGGGFSLYATSVNITGNASFTNNSAGMSGGGVLLYHDSSMSVIGNLSLIGNFAHYQGGGMIVSTSNLNITGIMSLAHNSAGGILFTNGNLHVMGLVSFIKNSAVTGGGIDIRSSHVNITGRMLLMDNSASLQGGGMRIQSSRMDINGILSLTNNSARSSGGGISLYNSSIRLSSSHVNVSDIAILVLKGFISQVEGGRRRYSKTYLLSSSTVYFIDNFATRGGAIYVEDLSSLVYCASDAGAECVIEDCFFQLQNGENVSHDMLVFEGNKALAGSVLYGGSVDRCRLEGHQNDSGRVFDMIANYAKEPETPSVISSDPFSVCLCENNQPHCNIIGENTTAYPGQTFPIIVAAVGQRNGTVSALTNSITNPASATRLGAFEERQKVGITCTELHYTFFSKETSNVLQIYVDGSCSYLDGSKNRLSINVKLLPCPHAFTLSELTDGCTCEERLQKYTDNCNINNQTIHRDRDFWVGYDGKSQGLILHPHCPFDYCQTKPVSFTLNETHLQCEYDRTGLLCGACQPGLSLALGGSRCLPCTNIYLSLLLPFAVMGLVFVLFLLAFKLTVAVGTANGLILYVNIVGANRSVFFPPGSTIHDSLAVFIAWLNLDFGIETCIYDGMDTYAKTWLQFAFPIYIWAIVGLIIFISARSRRISRMLGSNPVAVLATLFLLSYAKILRTIISTLSFTTLQYPNDETRVVWLHDANIRYLHGKHIPLFVIGLLFFAFVFLPYTLLLLLGQWLQAFAHLKIFSWMNNLKLKAFLDAYHAPYKGSHRYWPGLLLLVRLALLLVFGSNALGDTSVNLLAISSASFGLMVLAWTSRGIYMNCYLDALEASYILNLGILAVATNHVQQAGGNQAAVAYISTSMAFATFITIVFYHVYLQTKESRFWRVICCRKDNQPQDNEQDQIMDSGNKPLAAPTTTYVSYGSCTQLREPLLDAPINN